MYTIMQLFDDVTLHAWLVISLTVCLCHHLTHFGLLLRPSMDESSRGPLRLITVGGCTASALALILAVAFLLYQAQWSIFYTFTLSQPHTLDGN
jgi:hypothetical protein